MIIIAIHTVCTSFFSFSGRSWLWLAIYLSSMIPIKLGKPDPIFLFPEWTFGNQNNLNLVVNGSGREIRHNSGQWEVMRGLQGLWGRFLLILQGQLLRLTPSLSLDVRRKACKPKCYLQPLGDPPWLSFELRDGKKLSPWWNKWPGQGGGGGGWSVKPEASPTFGLPVILAKKCPYCLSHLELKFLVLAAEAPKVVYLLIYVSHHVLPADL